MFNNQMVSTDVQILPIMTHRDHRRQPDRRFDFLWKNRIEASQGGRSSQWTDSTGHSCKMLLEMALEIVSLLIFRWRCSIAI